MCARARFHANEARWQLCDQRRQMIARNTRLDQHRFAGLFYAVNGEYILGKIDSDSDNRHGLPLALVLMNVRNFIMASSMPICGFRRSLRTGSPFHSLGAQQAVCDPGLATDFRRVPAGEDCDEAGRERQELAHRNQRDDSSFPRQRSRLPSHETPA
jgi:hypothetical protein